MLRQEGYTAEVVERWIAQAKIRRDLFGFADIIAYRPCDPLILLVQTTTKSHISERIKKIHGEERAMLWHSTGNPIHVHGWFKNKSGMWECDQRIIVSFPEAE